MVFTKGKSWSSGGIDFEVLHPPEAGPSGNENTRSMVIEVGYKGFKMLLAGDSGSVGKVKSQTRSRVRIRMVIKSEQTPDTALT